MCAEWCVALDLGVTLDVVSERGAGVELRRVSLVVFVVILLFGVVVEFRCRRELCEGSKSAFSRYVEFALVQGGRLYFRLNRLLREVL